jgi:lysyl-tRNA synthetase, class II
MSTLSDYRKERLRKLSELKELGFEVYPTKSSRTQTVGEVLDKFEEKLDTEVVVAGRITSIRKMGKLAFIVLKDMSGSMQLFIREGDIQSAEVAKGENNNIGLEHINLLDTGDFVEARGQLIISKTGEKSVSVKTLRLLTKALRPMPSQQEGFTDKEQRLRRRYVDTNVNQDVFDRFIRRSKFWQSTRQFFLDKGFIEMSIPVLELTTGGADANPFVTHMDALDQDYYLRISHELPLKRLLGGGYEKVFDIGPRFRNENYSDEHLPEHMAMEWYWAYADWQDGMKLTQEMLRHIADNTWGTRKFTLANGQEVDLGEDGEDFPRVSFVDVIKERYGLDVFTCKLDEVKEQLKLHKLEVEKTENRNRGIDKLWKKIRVEMTGPAFLVDIPDFLQPLAKVQDADPRLSEQFNLLLGGTEACKAYSELNDPVKQLNNFVEQQNMRDAGDDEAMMLDIDYVEMLEYGMPPACGYGHSERLFWMLEGVTAREGVIFPQLRAEVSEVTKATYPELFK